MLERELVVVEQRLRPVRGLVPLQNARGRRYSVRTLRTWIRATRTIYRTPKADLLVKGDAFAAVPELLHFAEKLDLRLSLRTDCGAAPPDLTALCQQRLLDLFLCPMAVEESLDRWLDAAQAAGLPVRLQLLAPLPQDLEVERFAAKLAGATVRTVNVTLYDPFHGNVSADKRNPQEVCEQAAALARALQARHIEANLVRFPFCLFHESLWPNVVDLRQLFQDHQQYAEGSWRLAHRLQDRSPVMAAKAMLVLLGRQTSYWNPSVDRWLFPLLTHRPGVNIKLWLAHKLTRHWRWRQHTPKALEQAPEKWEAAIAAAQARKAAALAPPCAACSLRRICDTKTPELVRLLPGVEVHTQPGDLVISPMHFACKQPKHYDAMDAQRRDRPALQQTLASEANDIVENQPPTREIDSFQYEIVGQWAHQMPGGVRWHSLTNTEKISTVLTRIEPPCTLSVTFGGGYADYIGFAFGRHGRIVCDMDAFSHRLVLHVDKAGRYVLLRDGEPVRPFAFEDTYFVPTRLSGVLEPAISIWNIDGAIMTQSVFVWENAVRREKVERDVRYSFLIVSTRYCRRLQAVLQSIAHQENIDLRKVEVVIAYVPGIDAVDDLIESCEHSYPDLRLVRSPFSEQFTRAKGFMINDTVPLTSGDWIILLDSDTLMPPGMLAAMENLPEDVKFVASDGRKMLDEATTAKVLLGEIRPWESFQSLLQGPGEFRAREAEGVPIGFFQAVRRECFEKVRYIELDHFEGSDWQFGHAIRTEFGKEHRLSGLPVLHLDHGGSQWYGTATHR